MAHDFYARLMHATDDSVNYPNFPKHQLFAVLREVSRDAISSDRAFEKLKIDLSDNLAHCLISYIMKPSNKSERADRVRILEDIHYIHEYSDPNLPIKDLYPTEESLRQRIGI